GRVLIAHHWPGNIRELRSVIRRAVALATSDRDTLWVEDFGTQFTFEEPLAGSPLDDLSLDTAEKKHIQRVLELAGYTKSRTAEPLRISRPTLDKKIHDLRIHLPNRAL